MKKSLIVLLGMIFLWTTPVRAQVTPPLPLTDNTAFTGILSNVESKYLASYDRTCSTADLDGEPIIAVTIQPDLTHVDAKVFKLKPKPTDDALGYAVQVQGLTASFTPIDAKGVLGTPVQFRSMELWSKPVFGSQFRMGDFLPSLFMQMRFTGMEKKPVDGNPRTFLTSVLSIGEAENRELVWEIDDISGMPKGFRFFALDKKLLRTVSIATYARYAGKSYGRDVTVVSEQNKQKSRVVVSQMVTFKAGVYPKDLSTLTANNWKDFCQADAPKQ